MTKQEFKEKCISTYGIVMWSEFEADLTSLLQLPQCPNYKCPDRNTGMCVNCQYEPETQHREQPDPTKAKLDNLITGESNIWETIDRVKDEPEQPGIVEVNKERLNRLLNQPQAKGVSREEAEKRTALDKVDAEYYDVKSPHYKDNERYSWAVKTINERYPQSQPVNEGCPEFDGNESNPYLLTGDELERAVKVRKEGKP